MERRILMPGLLVVSIFAMAGVYDFMWIARPDYFRLQSGVNFLPLDLVHIAREYSAYSDNQPLPDMLPEHGEEVATKRIEDIYQNFRLASVSLANKKADLAKRLQQDAGEYKSFEQAQWAQYEEFVAQKSAPFAKQSNLISERMQSMLTAAGAISPDDLPPGPRNAYYDLNIERARVELQRVRAEAEARDYGLHHLTEFQQQTSQQAYLARSRELGNLRRSISDEQASTNTLHGELYDAFVDYRTAVEGKLGYWDFLYFSVGAATTATFGDISPNSTPVRMLVCLQVLGSIIFTGLMINVLASSRSNAKSTPTA